MNLIGPALWRPERGFRSCPKLASPIRLVSVGDAQLETE